MANIDILLRTTDFTGMPVISIKSGQQVAKVSDVVVDTKKRKISAFLLESDDVAHAKAVSFPEVAEIVSNHVYIKDDSVVKPAEEVVKFTKEENQAQQIVQTKVITKEGTELGKLSDLYFDPTKGDVKQIEYQTGSNGDTTRQRLKVGKIEFKKDLVEISPENMKGTEDENPLQKITTSIKEKIA